MREPKEYVLYSPEDLGLPFPECAGVYIGGCYLGEKWEGESAHAHVELKEQFGIICVRKPYLVWAKHSWRPRTLMWHEYAHILHGIQGIEGDVHGPEFKRICAEVLDRPEAGRTVV